MAALDDMIARMGLDVGGYTKAAKEVERANVQMEKSAAKTDAQTNKFAKALSVVGVAALFQFGRALSRVKSDVDEMEAKLGKGSSAFDEYMKSIGVESRSELNAVGNMMEFLDEKATAFLARMNRGILNIGAKTGLLKPDFSDTRVDRAKQSKEIAAREEDFRRDHKTRTEKIIQEAIEETTAKEKLRTEALQDQKKAQDELAQDVETARTNRAAKAAEALAEATEAVVEQIQNEIKEEQNRKSAQFEAQENRREEFINEGMMTPKQRRDAKMEKRKRDRLGAKFDATQATSAPVESMVYNGGTGSDLMSALDSSTVLKSIETNTKAMSNPPNH